LRLLYGAKDNGTVDEDNRTVDKDSGTGKTKIMELEYATDLCQS
jgi:hypothetical protein